MGPRKKAISDELAASISRGYATGRFTVEQLATVTGISTRSVYNIIARVRQTGNPRREKVDSRRLGRPRILQSDDLAFIRGLIAQRPDLLLEEMRDQLLERRETEISVEALGTALHRMGYTLKKITPAARERHAGLRYSYQQAIGRYKGQQYVFIDESACDRRTTFRKYAWSLKGERVVRHSYFVRGKRYSILPALTLDGMIHCKVHEGSFDSELFKSFISDLLDRMNPYPQDHSVIVMDNCRIHKNSDVIEMIYNRGMKVVFLPPYSPDFNPIELAFSAIKARMRRDGDDLREAMTNKDDARAYILLRDLVYSVTPEDAYGWFHKCGYV